MSSYLLDYITLTGAKGSKTPTIIIPEFLYLGDAKTARWFPHLLSNKITHVINLSGCSNFWETEEKILKFWNQQKESEQSLKKSNDSSNKNNEIIDEVIDNEIVVIGKAVENEINEVVNNEVIPLRYLKIDITDNPSSNIAKYFHECIDFIENAKSTNGRVYVHCLAGISRSASIVIAYLMNSQKIYYKQAFNLVKEKRPNVKPNQGFVKQLREFEKELFTVVVRHQCG
jgi:protein-tyrosine phosphatase